MDVIYQIIVLKGYIRPRRLSSLCYSPFIPYVIIRGPAARIARRWHLVSQHQNS
jgi:hypothetical protein